MTHQMEIRGFSRFKRQGIVFALVVLLGMGAASAPSSWALSQTGTLSTAVTVSSVFRLTLAVWKGGVVSDPTRFDLVPISALSFGTASVGQFAGPQPSVIVPLTGGGTAEGGLILKAETNQGNPWRFQVSENQPLTRSGGSETIADANFRYFTWSVTGEATTNNLVVLPLSNPDGSRFNSMSTTPFTLYNSSSAEQFTSDTRIHMQFGIVVPSVVPGTYGNNVIITYTE